MVKNIFINLEIVNLNYITNKYFFQNSYYKDKIGKIIKIWCHNDHSNLYIHR